MIHDIFKIISDAVVNIKFIFSHLLEYSDFCNFINGYNEFNVLI